MKPFSCSEEQKRQMREEKEAIHARMDRIGQCILVLSGKGGVGKSTVTVNLAVTLALAGKKVGILDIDIHGPSIPRILNLNGQRAWAEGDVLKPVAVSDNLKVMSIGLLLEDNDDAVIWRGPRKYQVIKQFLKDVDWGELDYLVIDSPPGTGDEPLAVIQLLDGHGGAVIVTTPQDVAVQDVRKGVNFCRELNMPILGVIENMSGFICPKCGEATDIFKSGGGEDMAGEMGVPFLGRIPIDPQIVNACDDGESYQKSYQTSQAAHAFRDVVAPLMAISSRGEAAITNE